MKSIFFGRKKQVNTLLKTLTITNRFNRITQSTLWEWVDSKNWFHKLIHSRILQGFLLHWIRTAFTKKSSWNKQNRDHSSQSRHPACERVGSRPNPLTAEIMISWKLRWFLIQSLMIDRRNPRQQITTESKFQNIESERVSGFTANPLNFFESTHSVLNPLQIPDPTDWTLRAVRQWFDTLQFRAPGSVERSRKLFKVSRPGTLMELTW